MENRVQRRGEGRMIMSDMKHTWEMHRWDTPGGCTGGTHLGDAQVECS